MIKVVHSCLILSDNKYRNHKTCLLLGLIEDRAALRFVCRQSTVVPISPSTMPVFDWRGALDGVTLYIRKRRLSKGRGDRGKLPFFYVSKGMASDVAIRFLCQLKFRIRKIYWHERPFTFNLSLRAFAQIGSLCNGVLNWSIDNCSKSEIDAEPMIRVKSKGNHASLSYRQAELIFSIKNLLCYNWISV